MCKIGYKQIYTFRRTQSEARNTQLTNYRTGLLNGSYLGTKSTKKRKPEVAQSECEVFIEEVTKEIAHSVVGPTTVHQ